VRHHTFFEMLGNFSFGDYFKEEAIAFAWQWLVSELQLDPARMVITVFRGEEGVAAADDEARSIWRRVSGFGEDRIFGLGMKDNFWMMGDTGPQGPCSEIHYYYGEGACDPASFHGEKDWVEIWNLVFMQFERPAVGEPLRPLPRPSIDTGAGLERIAAVQNNLTSNYHTDLLLPLVESAGEMAKKKYARGESEDEVSMRVLADHARATAFLMADGVMPSNEGRGYVLRRIMRRAIRHGVRLGLRQGDYRALCNRVVDLMKEPFPELEVARGLITKSVDAEDESFRRTIDRGMKLLDEQLNPGVQVPGEVVFKLYDTYGFPADLTRTIAEERGSTVDEAGFEREMEKQRARSSEFAGSGEQAIAGVYKELEAKLGETRFLGYETTRAESEIVALPSEREIVVAATPFYGESGGQIGDTGKIAGGDFEMLVEDTIKAGGLIVHRGKITRGTPTVGALVTLSVDAERRADIVKNHSATHLLHWALRKVLGEHVTQKGSLVAPDRLRFDFAHFTPMTEEEKRRVEELVNAEVLKNRESRITVTGFDEARALGAMALFGEKYGERVRVMQIGEHSVELCGGTHVQRTGDIGAFKITTEIGIAQGIRRIEAVTGRGAISYLQKLEEELSRAAERTRAPLFSVAASIEKLQRDLKERDRKIEELQKKMAMGGGGRDLLSSVREVNGVKVLAARSEVGDPKALREVADQLKNKLGSGVIVLGGVAEGKVALVAAVTADLVGKYNAGKIVGAISSAVGGKGGGRPDMAQGGGSDADKLDEALAGVDKLLT
jgi:alanyl-tRNA synthetase